MNRRPTWILAALFAGACGASEATTPAGGSAGNSGPANGHDASSAGAPNGDANSTQPAVGDEQHAGAIDDGSAVGPGDAATTGALDAGPTTVVRLPIFVVVVGSSTAAGFGLADPSTSWVARYTAYLQSDLPGSKLTNLAVSGYTTFQVQPTGTTNPNGRPAVDPAHNITAAVALHPDAIIVNLPSNDAAMGVPVDDSMANLKTVAGKAAQANVPIWISTSQPRKLDAAGIALLTGLRDRTEQEFGDHALDFFTPLAAPDGTPLPMYNQGDGIHPNAEGHRLLFEQVKSADLPTAVARATSASPRDR